MADDVSVHNSGMDSIDRHSRSCVMNICIVSVFAIVGYWSALDKGDRDLDIYLVVARLVPW